MSETISKNQYIDQVEAIRAEYLARCLRATTIERERCAKIADEFAARTNADIAHAIAAAIRNQSQ